MVAVPHADGEWGCPRHCGASFEVRVRGEELELLGAPGSHGVDVGCLGRHSALHPSFPRSVLIWLSVLQAVMHVLSTKCFASFMW